MSTGKIHRFTFIAPDDGTTLSKLNYANLTLEDAYQYALKETKELSQKLGKTVKLVHVEQIQ